MSELQLALFGAGAAVVVVVWAYNQWQERQHKRLAEKIFKGDQPDVLLQGQPDDERLEPSAALSDERIEPVGSELAALPESLEPQEPSAAATWQTLVDLPELPSLPLPVDLPSPAEPPESAPLPELRVSATSPAATAPLPEAWVDAVADCTVRIDFTTPIGAAALWAVQSSWAPQLSHVLSWFAHDEGPWRRLTAADEGCCSQVAVALPLADRRGVVSDSELGIYFDGVKRLAGQFGGHVELPSRQQVLSHAQSLDDFCAAVDVQLGVSIVTAGSAFAGTKLRGLAEAAGLVLAEDGRFHARADDGSELYAVGNVGREPFAVESLRTLSTPGLTFVLDVPRVASGVAVFNRMLILARQMAEALGGTLVDGQRHALGDGAIAGIRAKIGELQQQMIAHEIPPGSPRALRLFS